MLPAVARLTASHEYRLVVRRGRRAGRSRLVVHVLFAESRTTVSGNAPESEVNRTPTRGATDMPSARVGFVVSKAVGNAVVRHRVTRQLRHLVRERLSTLPPGTLVVVRALRPAAGSSSVDLGADLDGALRKAFSSRGRGPRGADRRGTGQGDRSVADTAAGCSAGDQQADGARAQHG